MVSLQAVQNSRWAARFGLWAIVCPPLCCTRERQAPPLATPLAPVISLPVSGLTFCLCLFHSRLWLLRGDGQNEPGTSVFWLNLNPLRSNQRASLMGNKDQARKESRFLISSPAVLAYAQIQLAFFQKRQQVNSQNNVKRQLLF